MAVSELPKIDILTKIFIIVAIIGAVSANDFPFKDTSLDWDLRVKDLVNRLTVEEMMYQMAWGGGGPSVGPAPAIKRLGILPYQWNQECLRGPAYSGPGTTFAQAIGLAAAFNRTLIHRVAHIAAVEVRAKFNDYRSQGIYKDHTGISCFSPVINLMRHPLWGRSQETYGEDPYLTGQYAQNYVRGMQGDHPRYLTASATCKHIDAYAGPDNLPVTRYVFDAKLAERDWRLTFLPAFKACLKGDPYGIMCSYNSINGVPSCANRKLLTDILRDEWGFRGYVVSDEGALQYIVSGHHYINDSVDAAAAAVKAGCNLEVSLGAPALFQYIAKAVEQEKLDVLELRQRVEPLFYTRMRIGEFDPPQLNPYSQYNLSLVLSPEHLEAAVRVASETFVLLKNNENLLPLTKKRFKKIAIVGPMANNLEQLYGDYTGDIDPKYGKTPLQGLGRLADTTAYAAGCVDTHCKNYTADDIISNVTGAQLVIICVGTGQAVESEMNDRHDMNLPGYQTQLVTDAVTAAGGSTPVILLVFSGGPVNISFADRNPLVSAIMQCFLPALATGDALFNTITMATAEASPSARLPYTWYDRADQIPSLTDYSMKELTYRYLTSKPLYPFGYGLSYSKFKYKDLDLRKTIIKGDDQIVEFKVKNIGEVDAYEVVQVYISWCTTRELMPNLQLVGFDKVFLTAGSDTLVQIDIDHEQMAVWTDKNGFVIEPGTVMVYVGGQQPNQARDVGSNILQASFDITTEDN